MNRHCRCWIMAFVASFAIFGLGHAVAGTCPTGAPTSLVYGYTVAYKLADNTSCTTTFQTLDQAESYLRGTSGNEGTVLAFPVIPADTSQDLYSPILSSSGSQIVAPQYAHSALDYRQTGYLGLPGDGTTNPYTYPFSVLQTGYAVYDWNWPPTEQQQVTECQAQNDACVGSPFLPGLCPTTEAERARVECQFQYTWNTDPVFCWNLAGSATLSQLPLPPANEVLNATFSDPSDPNRKTAIIVSRPSSSTDTSHMVVDVPVSSCSASGAAATTQSASKLSAAATASSDQQFGMGQQQAVSCADGSQPTTSGCQVFPTKAFIYPSTFKQTKDSCGVGDPCYPGNGNSTVTETGFRWGEITFNLYYNSLRELRTYAWIDQNWSASFAQRILTTSLTNSHDDPIHILLVQSDDALLEQFVSIATNVYRSTNQMGRTLTKNSDGTFSLRDTGGQVQVFDADGRIVQIVQNPGDPRKTLTISYVPCANTPCTDADKLDTRFWHVDTVADGLGHAIRFNYDSVPPDYRLLSVQAGNEILMALSYDTLQRLHTTTQLSADGSLAATRTYHYDDPQLPYNLTGIMDENGQAYFNAQYDDWGRVTASWHGNVQAEHVSLAYTDSAVLDTSNPPVVSNFQSYVDVTTPSGNSVTYDYTGGQPYRKPDTISVAGQGLEQLTYGSNYQVSSKKDRRNVETDYEYGDGVHQTARAEAVGTGIERRIETDYPLPNDPSHLNRPTARRVKHAGQVETEIRWVYDSNGALTGRCEYDPNIIDPSTYTCGHDVDAPAGVRQWIYSRCYSDFGPQPCPVLGAVYQINGPRSSTDPGMAGADDTTTFTYYDTSLVNINGCDDPVSAQCHWHGQLQSVTDGLGHTTTYVSYNNRGQPTRVQDANGVYTDMYYHPRGWLLSRVVRARTDGQPDPQDATTAFQYDDTGNITRVTQPDGSYLVYGYDDAHRLTSVTDDLSNSIAFELDSAGNRTSEKRLDSGSNINYWMKRTYNLLGQLHQVTNQYDTVLETYPDADGYDANGNPVHSVDAYNVQTENSYDPLNRLVDAIQDYQGGSSPTADTTTHYEYDSRDNLLSVTDPDALTTSYTYDGLNNLRQAVSPDTGTTVYETDAAGNRTSQTDARNVTTTYVYDALNRLTNIQYPTSSLDVTYTYDEAATGCYNTGRLTRMVDNSGSTTYCYDRRGNILSKTQITNGITLATSYSYTLADKLDSVTYPSGMIARYTRDSRGMITGVDYTPAGSQTQTPIISNILYSPFGPLSEIFFANGRTLRKGQHTDGSNYYVFSNAADGISIWYGNDTLGNLRNASTASGLNPPTRSYGLDRLYRLTEVDQGSTVLEKYTYNKTGDRLSALSGSYTYAVGTHRLTDDTSRHFTFDNAGNPSSLTVPVAGQSLNVTTTFDDRNRFASAHASIFYDNFNYNGKGERVTKSTNFQVSQNSIFVYNESGALLGEYSSTGALINEYVYADALPVAVTQSSGQAFYLETDNLGTPRVAVDPVRNVAVWKWDFFGSGFGNNAPDQDPDGDGTQFVLNLRYPGQYYDAETRFHYNYFRDYNPGSGRYLESDPVGLRGGTDTYAYALNFPSKFIDRDGAMPTRGDNVLACAVIINIKEATCPGKKGAFEASKCHLGESCLTTVYKKTRYYTCALARYATQTLCYHNSVYNGAIQEALNGARRCEGYIPDNCRDCGGPTRDPRVNTALLETLIALMAAAGVAAPAL